MVAGPAPLAIAIAGTSDGLVIISVLIPPIVTASGSITLKLLIWMLAPSTVFFFELPVAENMTSLGVAGTAPMIMVPALLLVQLLVPFVKVDQTLLIVPRQYASAAIALAGIPKLARAPIKIRYLREILTWNLSFPVSLSAFFLRGQLPFFIASLHLWSSW
jgi:hypothetical protein